MIVILRINDISHRKGELEVTLRGRGINDGREFGEDNRTAWEDRYAFTRFMEDLKLEAY